MKEVRITASAALFLLAVVGLVWAQGDKGANPPKAAKLDDALRLESDLVTVDVVATDAQGNFVPGLTAADFQVYEDDKLQKVEFFEMSMRPEPRPLAAVFALDVSGSIEPELGQVAEQQASAQRFMELLDRNSQFAVIAFNHEVKVLQGFTNKQDRIIEAFAKATDVGGSTRIYDAVDRAITLLKKAPRVRDGRRVRRVVILVSDGFDSSSVIDLGELIRRANSAEVTVYTITIPNYLNTVAGGPRQRAMTLLDLSRLAPRTGGMDYPADSYDFTPIFKSIRNELAASYTLAYYPPPASRDGRFHTINVKLVRPGLSVRLSRQGYQTQK